MATEAARKASATLHAKRKADGWRKVTVWLSPTAVERLDAYKAAYGWATDETVRRCITAGDPPKAKAGIAAAAREALSRPIQKTAPKMPKVEPVKVRRDTYPDWMRPGGTPK